MDADKLKIQKIESFLKQFQSYIALIIIIVVATLINIRDGENVFLSVPNLMNVLRAVSETGIIAIGMTMILILGDIDLSVGSIVGLVSTGCASLMVRNGLGMFPAVLLSLLIGGLYGLFNGLCVTKLKLQAFIVTLASMNIARGLARFWSNGVGIPLAYGKITVCNTFNYNPYSKYIIYLIQSFILIYHFLIDRKKMLYSAVNCILHTCCRQML